MGQLCIGLTLYAFNAWRMALGRVPNSMAVELPTLVMSDFSYVSGSRKWGLVSNKVFLSIELLYHKKETHRKHNKGVRDCGACSEPFAPLRVNSVRNPLDCFVAALLAMTICEFYNTLPGTVVSLLIWVITCDTLFIIEI